MQLAYLPCLANELLYIMPGGGAHSLVKNTERAGSIVWGLGFWLGKDILGFFKNIDLGNK